MWYTVNAVLMQTTQDLRVFEQAQPGLSFRAGAIIIIDMNRLLAGLLVIFIVLAGGYWYRFAESKCAVPVEYAVGSIDDRFKISEDEVRSAISDAESTWEDATGKNLFTYTPGASFTVNFVFDDRQETADTEAVARTELDTKEEQSEKIRNDYERVNSEYKKLKNSYETRMEKYEESLAQHNAEVESWNEKGGAPQEVYKDLNTRQVALEKEHQSLTSMARELNGLVTSINKLGDVGNKTVEEYNQDVSWYNSMFGGEREFTQGEYQGDHINIYQFDDGEELRRVLAHELGHALSLDHVEGDGSIMHYLLEGATADNTPSPEDMAEFDRVCGAGKSGFQPMIDLKDAIMEKFN